MHVCICYGYIALAGPPTPVCCGCCTTGKWCGFGFYMVCWGPLWAQLGLAVVVVEDAGGMRQPCMYNNGVVGDNTMLYVSTALVHIGSMFAMYMFAWQHIGCMVLTTVWGWSSHFMLCPRYAPPPSIECNVAHGVRWGHYKPQPNGAMQPTHM